MTGPSSWPVGALKMSVFSGSSTRPLLRPDRRPPLVFDVASVEYCLATFSQLAMELSFSSAACACSTFALSLLRMRRTSRVAGWVNWDFAAS